MPKTGERNHSDVVNAVLRDDAAAARSAVAASWRRSLTLYALDPAIEKKPQTLTGIELRAAQQAMEPMVRAAQSALDRLYLAVGNSGCCVLLTDHRGVPVDRRMSVADEETFHDWGLWPGAVWSEASEGTNGIGTCLAEGRALTIHRDQHFRTRNTLLSCTVAPVYDHRGRLAGALDVSSARGDLNEAMVGLIGAAVVDAARTIEIQHFRQAFPAARIVLVPDAERTSAALLAVDASDLVIGATRAARLSLGITDAQIAAELPAPDVLASGRPADDAELIAAERGAVKRALARTNGNVSAAAKLLGVSRATMHRKLARLGLARAH